MRLEDENVIARKIKFMRELRGYSQDSMASKLNLSRIAYLDFESGKTQLTVEKIKRVSEALEIDPTFLLDSKHTIFFNDCTNSGYFVNNNFSEDLSKFQIEISNLREEMKLKDMQIKMISDLLKNKSNSK